MLSKIISFIFRRRHYWREASFDEVAELYVSRLMTVFAVNIVSLFMAVYLYKLGYSIVFIALFYTAMYASKILLTPFFAHYVAYFGPKHGVLVANLMRLPSLIAMLLVPTYGIMALVVFGLFQGISVGMYNISYGVDFSKVRHQKHTGKELGVMSQIEQAGKVLAPLIGGLIAAFFGPPAAVGVASILFVLAAVPLFKTMEPVAVRGRVVYKGFPWRLAWRSFVASNVIGYDFVVSSLAWTFFIAITAFLSSGEEVYVWLGGLVSVSALISMVTAWFFGKVIDRRRGDVLFSAGVVSNTLIHLFRPFAVTPSAVLGVSITNETATSAYVLPWRRATFEIADTSGYRVAYFMLLDVVENIGAVIGGLVLAGLVWKFGDQTGLQLFFVTGAIMELTMLAMRRDTR